MRFVLYLKKLQTQLTKNINFFLLTEDRIKTFFSSKSSALSLLWNGKSKNLIYLQSDGHMKYAYISNMCAYTLQMS